MDNMIDDQLEQLTFFDETSAILYVSKEHIFKANVRSYQQLLKRTNPGFTIEQVAMDAIALKRRAAVDAGDGDGVDRSEMQRIAQQIFLDAVKQRASDIHIRVASKTAVLFRIHNDLIPQQEHPANWGKLLSSAIYTAMSDISDATYEELSRQDGRISSRSKLTAGLDGIRIATSPQVGGTVMVLRMLYNDADQSNDLEKLGFMPEQKAVVSLMRRRPTGLNIIAGPTGSGKSTTLQRNLLSIYEDCKGTKHIITVEDPPEYPMPGIVQTPVANANSEDERSRAFQEAIKSSMRLDPNVIMIGEMRDSPSAKLGVQAAMTGHQVWTTLHANGAFAIIDRMVDMGVPLNIMTDPAIVTGLLCQRLLKVLCPHCKIPLANPNALAHFPAEEVERIMSAVDISHTCVARPGGCPHCNKRGVVGRTVAAEVVITDSTLMGHIRRGMRDKAIEYWKSRGGKTMLDIALLKVNEGVCDPFQVEEEVGPLDFASNAAGDK